jgi:stearoyl-CoA desaturase (delta-9 desaturase)
MLFLSVHLLITLYVILFHFSWWMLLFGWIIAKLFNAIGNEVALHRLWCHKSYQTTRWKEFILHLFAIPLLYGTSITYTGVHRMHHAYADTERDPHITRPWWKVTFYIRNEKYAIGNKYVSDLVKDPWHRWTHKHYFTLNFLLLLTVISLFGIVYAGWFLSFMVIYNFIAAGLVNVLGHRPEYGTRTFDTDDNSSNNLFLQLLTWNEGLHNHHHHNAGSYTYVVNKGDYDFPGFLIKKFFMKHE